MFLTSESRLNIRHISHCIPVPFTTSPQNYILQKYHKVCINTCLNSLKKPLKQKYPTNFADSFCVYVQVLRHLSFYSPKAMGVDRIFLWRFQHKALKNPIQQQHLFSETVSTLLRISHRLHSEHLPLRQKQKIIKMTASVVCVLFTVTGRTRETLPVMRSRNRKQARRMIAGPVRIQSLWKVCSANVPFRNITAHFSSHWRGMG